jgi:hypothetical protein
LYVADCFNSWVQKFRSGERNGITVAGNGASGTVILNKPIAVILDGSGYLYIADAARKQSNSKVSHDEQLIRWVKSSPQTNRAN